MVVGVMGDLYREDTVAHKVEACGFDVDEQVELVPESCKSSIPGHKLISICAERTLRVSGDEVDH